MSRTISSTTDTPEQVTEALAAYGYESEPSVEIIASGVVEQPETVAEEVKTDPPSEVSDADKTADPKTADDTESPDTPEQEKENAAKLEAEKAKGKGGFQKRIDKLTEKTRLAEAEANDLRRQLADRTAAKPEEKPAPTKATETPEPQEADFEDYPTFLKALTKHAVDAKVAELQEQEAQRQQAQNQERVQAEQNERIASYTKRLDAGREAHDDFDDVVGNEDIPISEAMQVVIIESEKAAELVYHLGKNPEEAARISKLTPLQAARALGKIEATFSEETPTPTPKPKPVSTAPAPVKPVSTRSATGGKNPDDMDAHEYRAWRNNGGGKRK